MNNILNNYPWEGVLIVISLLAAVAIIGSLYLIVIIARYVRQIREEERAEESARWQLGWRDRELRAVRSELRTAVNDNRVLAEEIKRLRGENE